MWLFDDKYDGEVIKRCYKKGVVMDGNRHFFWYQNFFIWDQSGRTMVCGCSNNDDDVNDIDDYEIQERIWEFVFQGLRWLCQN